MLPHSGRKLNLDAGPLRFPHAAEAHVVLTFAGFASRIFVSFKPAFRQRRATHMQCCITLKLYATLQAFLPAGGEDISVTPGTTIRDLLRRLEVPEDQAQLIFINGVKGDLLSALQGGERVGIFPPVGGG